MVSIYKKKKAILEPYSYKNSLNDSFEQIYVICLPERLNYIKSIMDSLNINPIYFKAILKNNININQYIENQFISPNYKLNIGQIACHHSHLSVINKFLKSNRKNCLIFEDDLLKPTNNYIINKIVNIIMVTVPVDYDIIYFGKCWSKCKNNTKINKYLYKTNSRILCRHSYALSRAGAYKVLHNTLPLTTNGGDVEISNLITSNKLNAYYSNPTLFFQNRSTIESELGHYNSIKECVDVQFISNII